MARRRPLRGASSRKSLSKLRRFVCEQLEERKYLLVLHDGDTFTWRGPQPAYNIDTVSVGGNPGSTELEVVFVRYNNSNAAVSLGNVPGILDGGGALQQIPQNLPPPPTQNPPITVTRTPYFDDFVWSIYVIKSDSSSTIGFEEFNALTGAPQDYSGQVSLNTIGLTNRGIITAPANTGTLLMGGESLPLQPITNNPAVPPPTQPPLDVPLIEFAGPLANPGPTVFPDIPSSIATINPGIIVTAGNDFGNFVFGGTVVGNADFGGSLDNFYAGWLIFGSVWTGDNAFVVAGDVTSVISKGSIGTDDASLDGLPLLDVGFTLTVGGRLGMVRTSGDFLGETFVTGAAAVPGTAASSTAPTVAVETRGGQDGTLSGLIGQDASSENDTFNTPQILPVSMAGEASVDGQLLFDAIYANGNPVDYYGVALMAGQTVTVQLSSIPVTPQEPIHVGVFDPDGVEVATDYNAVDDTFTIQQPFQITATKAGLYRFAVGVTGDTTFTGSELAQLPYNLTITGAGNVSFGGILAAGIVRDRGNGVGFSDTLGDIGAIMAIGNVFESQDNDTFVITNGNLRAAQGTSLDDNSVTTRFLTLDIPLGSVGLLSATAGTLSVETDPLVPLGGNLQISSSTSTSLLEMQLDGSIGVIRASDMATATPSLLQCNFLDNPNTPATIDLIDVTGDFGTLASGGPAIIMGQGGDVKYIHVGGNVYQDIFFGGGEPTGTLYQPGEAVQIVDDSGTVVNLAPSQQVTNINTGAVTTPAGQLTVTTYGIEGSGGSAIVKVQSTESVTITVTGNNPNQAAEIGEIDVSGAGTAVIPAPPPPPNTTASSGSTTANGGNGTGTGQGGTTSIGGQGATTQPGFPGPGQPGGPPIKTSTGSGTSFQVVPLPTAPALATTGQTLSVLLNGNAAADVYQVNGGNFTSIENQTAGGQIVGGSITSVGTLSSTGSIGMDPGTLGEQVNGESIFNNTYPFVEQHYGLNAQVGIVSVSAGQVANINVVNPNGVTLGIGSISGDVTGAIFTAGAIDSGALTGMAWAGSGAAGLSGLYSTEAMGTLNITGDTRGDIVSSTGIQTINVTNNASLINAYIGDIINLSAAAAINTATTIVGGVGTPITNPIHDIGHVTVSGNGGISGTKFDADHIGVVSVGGYGAFDSVIVTAGDGTLDTYEASGYGLRFGYFFGGASAGNIIAIGNGSIVPTSDFSGSVRQSEGGGEFDPNTGLIFSPLNDIDVALGVTATQPESENVTDRGIIEDFQIFGSRNISLVSAYEIRSRPLTVGDLTLPVSQIGSVFNIANQIGTLQTTGGINSLVITTGRINVFKTNSDTANFFGTFAGSINNLVINSNLDASSTIDAIGPNGHINNLTIKGNLAGTVISQTYINNITVDGSITGTITATRIGTVHVHNGLAVGGLTVNGPISKLIFDGDGGITGQTITLNGNAKEVKIGGNLLANINVAGNLTQFIVGGSILAGSNSVISGTISTLQIAADIQAGASVTAQLIKKQKIKGTVSGSIIIS